MKKYVALFILIVGCWMSAFGAVPSVFKDYYSPVYVFRLENQLVDELFSPKSEAMEISTEFFRKMVEDNRLVAQFDAPRLYYGICFLDAKSRIDSMALGNYLMARLEGKNINYDYYSTFPYRIALDQEYEKLALFLCDSLGHPLSDAEVSVAGEILPYNASTQRYEATQHYDQAKIRVLCHGYLSYFIVEKEKSQPSPKRRLAKFFQAVGRTVKDPVTSIRTYEPVGYISKFGRLFEKIADRKDGYNMDNESDYRNEFREYYNYETGEYMDLFELRNYDRARYLKVMNKCVRRDQRHQRELTWEEEDCLRDLENMKYSLAKGMRYCWIASQPKYKPNDTVRVKGFVYQKGRRYDRSIDVSLVEEDKYGHFTYQREKHKILREGVPPCVDGVYTYDFAICDSLQLRLDQSYRLVFWNRRGKLLGSASFRYEDYVLRDASLNGSYDQPQYYKGDSIRVKVTAKDANGIPFPDALVKVALHLENVETLLNPRSFYPYELASQKRVTNGAEELDFVFPPSVAAGNNIQFKADVSLILPDGKVEEKQLAKRYYYTEKHSVSIRLDKDSLLLKAQYNGKDTNGKASVYVEDAFGHSTLLADTMLPCALRVEPSYANYSVQTAQAHNKYAFSASSSMAALKWRKSGDTLYPEVVNALHLPMVCHVFRDGEEIFSGNEMELPDYYPWDKEKSYILQAHFLWAGRLMALEDVVRVPSKNQLRIEVDEPSVITPGMNCEMEVRVTDVEGEPVKDADVTAFAVNSQFNAPSPNWNWPDTYRRIPTVDYRLKSDVRFLSAPLNLENKPFWNRLCQIDTLPYYHLFYPERDAVHHYSYYPADSITQISPVVCQNGGLEDVWIAYIDDAPCFILSASLPYSFAISPNEFHRLRLRTKTAEYTIDSVKVEPNKRTILSVDVNSTSSLVSRKKMPDGFTGKELEQLKPYLMLFEKGGDYSYDKLVREDGSLLYVAGGIHDHRFAGPISDSIRWMSDSFDVKTKVDHALVYSYDRKNNRLVTRAAKKEDYPQSFPMQKWYSLNQELRTLKRLEHPKESKTYRNYETSLSQDYPRDSSSNNRLEVRSDKHVYRYLLIPYNKRDMSFAVVPTWNLSNRGFSLIEAGMYRIYLVNDDTTCYRMDSVRVVRDSLSLARFDKRLDRVMADTFAYRLRSLLTFTHNEENAPTMAQERLIRFLLENDSFPFIEIPDFDPLWGDYVVLEEGASARKHDVTGALLSVSSASVDNALQGRVSGVRVTSAYGQPGGSSTVLVRGASSLTGASEPLYVVDGMPLVGDGGNPLADINPADIMSMEVLREPSATAIYGSRAAGGVIIITTRGGKSAGTQEIPAGVATLRTRFSDQGFWRPTLRTDKEGKVRFSVTFPDNITRWQTIYLADAPLGESIATGSVEGSIKSFVPLSARLYLPEFLVRGDACSVHGKLTNYLQDTAQVTTSFTVNDSLVATHLHHCAATSADSLLLVPQGDSLSVTYQFVSDNHFSDGERRKVKVLPQGVSCTEGRFAVLHDTLQISLQSAKADSVTIRVMNTQCDLLRDEVSMLTNYPFGCNEQTTSKLVGYMVANQDPNISKLQRRTNDKKLKDFIQTLKDRQLPNGLWGWWNSDLDNKWISRYIVETLTKYQIDYPRKKAVETCRSWVENSLKISDRIWGLTMLRTFGEKMDYQTMVAELDTMKNLTLHDRLELAELKTKCGLPNDYEWLRKYRKETMKGGVYYHFGEACSVDRNEVMTTLQVYRILRADSLADHQDELRKMRDYFYGKKSLSNTAHWRNTYESAMIVRTLSDDVKFDLKQEFSPVRITGALREEVEHFPYERKVPTEGSLTMIQRGDAPVYVSLSASYWDQPDKANGSGFSIQTLLSDSLMEVGKLVKMRVVVQVEKDAEYVLIHVPIPAGCTYASKEQSRKNNEVYREYYKDHTNIFCSELPVGVYEFILELSPYCAGNYRLNPAKVEQMYAPEFNAHNEMKRVKIVKTR